MISIVVPAKNEASRILQTLNNCKYLPADYIIPVLNGCTDSTKKLLEESSLEKKIRIIEFPQSLGIDVPRAIGAAFAYKLNSQVVLFLDGDMQGNISYQLNELIDAMLKENLDMALTDCYPNISSRTALANTVLNYREKLNRHLQLFQELGLATPSHGPHALSRKLLELLPWKAIAIPPLSLAMAKNLNLNIKVVTSIPHDFLLSPLRNDYHSSLIAETIIGDSLEAISFLQGLPPSRKDKDTIYQGYHLERRFDLLDEFLKTIEIG